MAILVERPAEPQRPRPEAQYRFGWIPDYPDFRDYTPDIKEAATVFAQSERTTLLGTTKAKEPIPVAQAIPPRSDLRTWFSPVHDQGNLGSCTAHAADSIVEYFERRAFNTYVDVSRRFVYKVTRELLDFHGDTGATIRGTMGALALFGAPPEKFWAYDVTHYDEEPPAFCYALAENYKAVTYYRLDPPGILPNVLLDRIRQFVAAGFPPMFGFSVYSCTAQADTTGMIPYPVASDTFAGGHAVAVAGYDNKLKIKNAAPGAKDTTGALLIKNSWGSGWGDNGYGWLPYEYVLQGQARDWWSLVKATWIETGQFGFA